MTGAATVDAVATGFARTLRAAGLAASSDRLVAFVEALATLDPTRRDDVYWAGRLTLCGARDDLGRYDRAFAAYFGGEAPHRQLRPGQRPGPARLRAVRAPLGVPGQVEDDDDAVAVTVGASRAEVLRKRDLATLTPADREEVNRMLAALSLPGERRRTRRRAPARRGRIDRRATVREALHGRGDPRRIHWQRPRSKPRRVVMLVDVSGSMSSYADALLRFAHVATLRPGDEGETEVFALGTRLTRITEELDVRDTDAALAAVAGAIPDWSGGTRLGDGLAELARRRRELVRGAVLVVLSDGWERGDPARVGEAMRRLSLLARRIVWSNPRKGARGYAPLVGGMAAALPHVDDFVEGHSLGALEELARRVAGARHH